MPPSLDQARVALAAQPFSRLLGAHINSFAPHGVELEVPVRPEHRQQHGYAHGGCSAMRPTTPSPSPPARSLAPEC